MPNDVFDELQQTLATHGPGPAVDRLCDTLRQRKDYGGLFYALLLKKRQELGVSPVPTEPADALPQQVHQTYEEGIREAARTVGSLYLHESDIPRAWLYYRMIGETAPVREALERCQPGEEDDVQRLIEVAFHEGVHPTRGFDWVLERHGLCSAITMTSSLDFGRATDVREHCVRRLVRTLYQELRERLAADIERQEGKPPPEQRVRELMAGRDYLFADEFYHVDVSHLSSVVQMSIHLPPGEELEMARELCAYGERLSDRFQYAGEPPFENQYRDYGMYLATLAGDNVEEGIAHFQAKAAQADPENDGTNAAEVLVNLLLRLGRPAEALAVARRYLVRVDRQLSCPNLVELCRLAGDYGTLAEVAREQQDPVHYLAGLLAQRG